jgi:hypothetical protein
MKASLSEEGKTPTPGEKLRDRFSLGLVSDTLHSN